MFISTLVMPPFQLNGRAVFLCSLQGVIRSLRYAIGNLVCCLLVQRGDARDR